MLTEAGVTVTVATGFELGLTVTLELPLIPSQVAMTVALPDATPLTRPVDETEATLGASLDQVIVRPLRILPDAERGVAVSCAC